MNPALMQMMARDRMMELQANAARRPSHADLLQTAAPQTTRARRHVDLTNPQRAVGWFLISLGLRLAVPRTRTGAAR